MALAAAVAARQRRRRRNAAGAVAGTRPHRPRSRDGSPAPSQEQTQLVNVTVPPMKMSGDVIQVEMEGQMFDVTVPRGVRAGQSFEVELPAAPPPKRADDRIALCIVPARRQLSRCTHDLWPARTTAGATTTTFGMAARPQRRRQLRLVVVATLSW